jgi:hypothetical protein
MTDAPEAPRQEREALARLIDPFSQGAPDNDAGEAADRILAAGYVTPEAHAAALAASQAEVERLRNALKPFAVAVARDHPIFGDSSHELISTTLGDIRRARAALAASQPQGGE